MTNFDTSHVKNIVLLGHAGSGKTTFAESMLFTFAILTLKIQLRKHDEVAAERLR